MGSSAGTIIAHLLPLLLLLPAASARAGSGVGAPIQQQRFREAPQFYNADSCASPVLEPSANAVCSPSAIAHIAITLDVSYLRGSMAAVLSVLQHASCPQSVQFHFVASSAIDYLNSTLSSTFPYLSYRIYPFDGDAVSGLISTSIRSALDNSLNYARSYLPRLLPRDCPKRVVYLDSDVVVVDDIATLAATHLDTGAVVAAPEYCKANLTAYFTPTFWANPVLSMVFDGRKACYFNTGVMVIDIDGWRGGGYTEKIEEWMELQKRMRIYELGSLPPFLLVFAGRVVAVDHQWNQHGLGGDNYRGLCRELHPGPVSLLHWSGKGKPWARIDAGRPCPVDALWAPYDLLQSPFDLQDS